MSYTVNGYIDGVSYQITVGDDVADEQTGVVTGSPNALALLLGAEGDTYGSTVTGEHTALDLHDPESVLPALQSLTEITSIEGDAPEVESEPNVIY